MQFGSPPRGQHRPLRCEMQTPPPLLRSKKQDILVDPRELTFRCALTGTPVHLHRDPSSVDDLKVLLDAALVDMDFLPRPVSTASRLILLQGSEIIEDFIYSSDEISIVVDSEANNKGRVMPGVVWRYEDTNDEVVFSDYPISVVEACLALRLMRGNYFFRPVLKVNNKEINVEAFLDEGDVVYVSFVR